MLDNKLAARLELRSQSPTGDTFHLGAQSQGVGPFAFVFDNLVCEAKP